MQHRIPWEALQHAEERALGTLLPSWRPPNSGEALNGRSDAPGRSLAKYALVVRVESSAGDKWSDPNAGPFLSWVVCVRSISCLQTGRAGFLKSARPTQHRARQSTNTQVSLVVKGHFQPTFLPRLALQVKGASPDERQRAATWWRGARQQGGAVPFAPRLHTCTPLLLGSEHQSQISPMTQEAGPEGEGLAGARTPVCSKMLSVLRSGWNDHSFESEQTDFSEMCQSSFVFPLKEPRARSV